MNKIEKKNQYKYARLPHYLKFKLFLIENGFQTVQMFKKTPSSIKLYYICSRYTYMVPLAAVIFKLLSTWFAFDLLPYCLKACRTQTACCFRFQTPSSMFIQMPGSAAPLQYKQKETKIVFNIMIYAQFNYSLGVVGQSTQCLWWTFHDVYCGRWK